MPTSALEPVMSFDPSGIASLLPLGVVFNSLCDAHDLIRRQWIDYIRINMLICLSPAIRRNFDRLGHYTRRER